MIIKVCGMIEAQNVRSLIPLGIDWVGFIFYEPSKRYVEKDLEKIEYLKNAGGYTAGLERVGVFVNESFETILEKVKEYHLTYVQLHGDENSQLCDQLQKAGLGVIKAFSVDENFEFRNIVSFEFVCDYFLFDTKGKDPGGNGISFDWTLLKKYHGRVPFLLSGGIGPDAVDEVAEFYHPAFAGIDLNSKFEIEPGLKDLEKIRTFITDLSKKIFTAPDFWSKM
ncbi:MAG: phosphoribosylanthranilate isomerase [Saprospiraceae bacterium]|nr:phosphoribosylanthranilate isomerase [Saprospiraceae bacterium]